MELTLVKDSLHLICAGVQEHFKLQISQNGMQNIANYKTMKLSTLTNKANEQKKISEVRKWNRVEADQVYHSAETNPKIQVLI